MFHAIQKESPKFSPAFSDKSQLIIKTCLSLINNIAQHTYLKCQKQSLQKKLSPKSRSLRLYITSANVFLFQELLIIRTHKLFKVAPEILSAGQSNFLAQNFVYRVKNIFNQKNRCMKLEVIIMNLTRKEVCSLTFHPL